MRKHGDAASMPLAFWGMAFDRATRCAASMANDENNQLRSQECLALAQLLRCCATDSTFCTGRRSEKTKDNGANYA